MSAQLAEPDPSGPVWALEYDGGESCAVVSLAGQAGIGDCSWISPLLGLRSARGGGRTVVDLSRLSSIDWWAALILLWAGRVIRRRGGELVLASAQPAVARLLSTAGARCPAPADRAR